MIFMNKHILNIQIIKSYIEQLFRTLVTIEISNKRQELLIQICMLRCHQNRPDALISTKISKSKYHNRLKPSSEVSMPPPEACMTSIKQDYLAVVTLIIGSVYSLKRKSIYQFLKRTASSLHFCEGVSTAPVEGPWKMKVLLRLL